MFKDLIRILPKLVRYNLKVIFAGKFLWFLLASFSFFAFFMVLNAYQRVEMSESLVFNILFFPSILLVFYPSVFGIQNDEDCRILEIIFGIPNYRYKVWLLRLVIIYAVIAVVLAVFAYIANFLLYPVNSIDMAFKLMFPVVFIGNLAFMFSTLTRSGNGTAVLLVILGILMTILISANLFGIATSYWNIKLDPFKVPDNIHPIVWSSTLIKNTVFLVVGSTVWLLIGLRNLQKREKFV